MLAQPRYASALAVYKDAERLFLSGEIGIEQLYWPSRMLLDAQRATGDPVAAHDHLKRMEKFHKAATAAMGLGHISSYEFKILNAFVTEAEYWVKEEESWP